ncbi:MAG TPA: MMPL family transporter [Jiangellales bacterium]|nr:MMPL family transporter [Jiangellales bacterium]
MGRIRWLLPGVLVLIWLTVGGVAGPYAGKLAEVQVNDRTAFLPDDAESTKVADALSAVQDDASLSAIVVIEYGRALDDVDLSEADELARQIGEIDAVTESPSAPAPSEDGLAVQIAVPVDGTEDVAETVAQIRDVVQGAGQQAFVTGPAGFAADLSDAFGNIDGLLLLVALSAVLVILLIVYRSPLLPVLVLSSAVLALTAASAIVYALADRDVLTLNGQSQGIMFILVVGAATDYALLLVARFREALREQRSGYRAMAIAVRRALPPILASGGTVILGVLCLLASSLDSNRSLGPVAAIGITMAMTASLTFLPAVLALLGRAVFWPFAPRHGESDAGRVGVWGRIARLVGSRPRQVWVVTAVALAALAAFVPRLDTEGVSQSDLFLSDVESVQGQRALAAHFPAGAGSPAFIVAPAEQADAAGSVVASDPGVAQLTPLTGPATGRPDAAGEPAGAPWDQVLSIAVLNDPADSSAAVETIGRLRADLDSVSPDALVGGETAVLLDTQEASSRDLVVIIPLVLLVVLFVLVILLRSVLAPVLLVAANVLSFAATLGAAALVFEFVFGFDRVEPAVPLYGFVFLIALGIDYSIFLMTRVREEARQYGTRPGILRGLTVTGGVITSAGVVLAATFAALAVVPLSFLVQIAFIVAVGVLVDTLVVRSLLVPALSYDLGDRIWWPRRETRSDPDLHAPEKATAGPFSRSA